MQKIVLDGNSLTLAQLQQVADNTAQVELSPAACKAIDRCRTWVEKIIAENRTVYGLTTGFGKFATIKIAPDEVQKLQENLILSHATGVGNPLSERETRAIMLLRINVLAHGHSGIRRQTLQTLIDMLNAGVHPIIPEKGSVGASGDLAPLSHLALVLIGHGKAMYKGQLMDGAAAMQAAGLQPVKLQAKEGLALNNGTQVMAGLGALELLDALNLCQTADICAAASVDALLGTPAAFDPLVHKLRPHTGQLISAANLTSLLANSPLRDSHQDCENVQDAYSLRCTPQVHGATREALAYVQKILETEINAATDNPLIFPDEERVISGGNFHGEPIAIALDTLAIAVSELASISERRMEQMYNPALNRGLHPFLATKPGLDSGFMIAQLTAASLVSENKVLSHPASVDSIPTSANQEDHVSMGATGAVKARTVVTNASFVLGIELMSAVQALEMRGEKTSPVLEQVKSLVRTKVQPLNGDRQNDGDINAMQQLVLSGQVAACAKKSIELN